ncbi:hypothetical protein NW801_01270 [Brevibacillus laterosporus]|uniref:Lipoprotein n=2 Tax=Brevibacillus TaxID=55080 RepID=A0A0F7EH34_BRELA|nr:hypothetical protein [Brevibacillus laterosporus]AKF94540.1 hypothetical protein EX87_13505 [Brevibacillus laterosporus]MCR8983705.1 hypothetical protein [Brevibacillus laterosporus]MCZ0829423.1 hypothetical protein [Brevibacillus halotolerans]
MKKSWHVCLMSVIWTCLVVVGCSTQSNGYGSEEKVDLSQVFQALEGVSILTTTGQEIPLSIEEFEKNFTGRRLSLMMSKDRLKDQEVKFRLIAYRQKEAPLVLEVGEQGFTYANNTYRGENASVFYQTARKQLGLAIIKVQELDGVEFKALDLPQSNALTVRGTVAQEAIRLLAESKMLDQPVQAYPIYPSFQVNYPQRPSEPHYELLQPTLLRCVVGRETIYYKTNPSLYQLVSKLLPDSPKKSVWEELYEATQLEAEDIRSHDNKREAYLIKQNLMQQGRIHQAIRVLSRTQPSTSTMWRQEDGSNTSLNLTFTINKQRYPMKIEGNYVFYQGKQYYWPNLQANIEAILFTRED